MPYLLLLLLELLQLTYACDMHCSFTTTSNINVTPASWDSSWVLAVALDDDIFIDKCNSCNQPLSTGSAMTLLLQLCCWHVNMK